MTREDIVSIIDPNSMAEAIANGMPKDDVIDLCLAWKNLSPSIINELLGITVDKLKEINKK
jgi:hypothetical protein